MFFKESTKKTILEKHEGSRTSKKNLVNLSSDDSSDADVPENVYHTKINSKRKTLDIPGKSERVSFVHSKIKNECKGELGILNPFKAFECLNEI